MKTVEKEIKEQGKRNRATLPFAQATSMLPGQTSGADVARESGVCS